jgi:hypothetical protein
MCVCVMAFLLREPLQQALHGWGLPALRADSCCPTVGRSQLYHCLVGTSSVARAVSLYAR